MENLGGKIKKIRDRVNLSQERFGKRLGVSGQTISAYERGIATPPLRILEKISEVYEVSIYDLPKSRQEDIEKKINDVFEAVNKLRHTLAKSLTL